MQTVAKQEAQSQPITEPALIPESVKKIIEPSTEKIAENTNVSGSLSRLLDASSDCV